MDIREQPAVSGEIRGHVSAAAAYDAWRQGDTVPLPAPVYLLFPPGSQPTSPVPAPVNLELQKREEKSQL